MGMAIGDEKKSAKVSDLQSSWQNVIKSSEAHDKEGLKSGIKGIISSIPHQSAYIKKQVFGLIRRMVHAPKAPYRQFRLAGRKRVVTDRRDLLKRQRVEPRESQQARNVSKVLSEASQPASGTFEPMEVLSQLEKLLVACFENGEQVGKKSSDGKPHFKAKTVEEWRGFFSKFASEKKKVALKDVMDLLFRGVVEKGPKAVVISDLKMRGIIEKFVRFSVIADAVQVLKTLQPGQSIPKEILKLSSEQLAYLALMSSAEASFASSPEESRGIFTSERIEAALKEKLATPLSSQLEQKTKILRSKTRRTGLLGMLGFWREKEGTQEEGAPERFVGWRKDLEKPQIFSSNSVRMIFYLALFTISILGIALLIVRLLKLL